MHVGVARCSALSPAFSEPGRGCPDGRWPLLQWSTPNPLAPAIQIVEAAVPDHFNWEGVDLISLDHSAFRAVLGLLARCGHLDGTCLNGWRLLQGQFKWDGRSHSEAGPNGTSDRN